MSEEILNKIVGKLDGLDDKVSGLDSKVDRLDKQVDVIAVEVVNMKEQLKNTATKEDLIEIKSEIIGEVDRFIKLHEILDTELASLRNKYTRLEERLEVVEQKLQTA